MPIAATAALQLGGTLLLNLASALLVGAVASMASRGADQPVHPQAPRRDRWVLTAGALLALIGSAMLLWWQAAAMAELPLADAGAAIAPVLTATHYGQAWGLGVVSLCFVLAIGGWGRTPGRANARTLLAGLGVALFAASRSAVGHASGGEFGLYGVIDWAHLLFVSWWAGEVFMALTWMPRSGPESRPDSGPNSGQSTGPQLCRRLARLSSTATWALVGVAVTGALLSWNGIGAQPQALISSAYGWALTVKLGLVAIAVALGGYNRFVTLPRLLPRLADKPIQPGAPWTRFVTVLRVEAGVLVAVLVAAAVLATRAPPG
jgi:putative copper resistance protein D